MSTENNGNENKLTNRDLWKVFLHQLTIRGTNNYERQQNAGFTEAMMPVIEKYYEDPEEKKEAYARHMEYFLTNDITSAIPVGVAAAMEERYATEGDIDPDSINAVKTALMGPLAGLGDSLKRYGQTHPGRYRHFTYHSGTRLDRAHILCDRHVHRVAGRKVSGGVPGL